MCGIAGAFDLEGRRSFSPGRLLAMTGAIAHRGPDDEQVHLEPGLAMGARRLSIVDLAGGRQPIANEDGTVWVTQNGEIFEYPELQAELVARGHRLATRCDTELWVHLYEDLGEEMFRKTRGQYAVAALDRKSRSVILGRDRVGIAPLYCTVFDGWLLWGSEIKALLSSGLVAARPDPKGIDLFFHTFCAGTSRTYFEGIHSIPPGQYLRVRDGRVEPRTYWDLDFPDAGQERRLADPTPLIDELEALMRQSVEKRLRGDVPVVSYISGGLDSTVVLGLNLAGAGLCRCRRSRSGWIAPAPTSDPTPPSRPPQGLPAVVTMNHRDIVDAYPELIRAAEGPVMDSSCACLMRLAGAVHSQGFKVALTGEGARRGARPGYPWFKALSHPRLAQRGRALVRQLGGPEHGAGLDARQPARCAARLGVRGVRTAQQDVYDLMAQGRSFVYSGDLWRRLAGHHAYDDLDITNDRFNRWDPLNQSLYVGYKVMLAGLLLQAKGDRVAMNSSVEARYPLLDEDVIAFCASIAPEYKLRGRTDKWLLRQVAARTLPPRIANRPKTMFRASRSAAFFAPDRPLWVDQLLSPESLRATGWFDPEGVARERAAQVRFPAITPKRIIMDLSLTCVVATQLWHHTYLGGGLCDLPVWEPTPIREGAAAAIDLGVSLPQPSDPAPAR